VIPPAKTGNLKTNKKTVIIRLQTKRETWSNLRPVIRILKIVVRKLIPPKIELTPAKCKLKIAKSTDAPL